MFSIFVDLRQRRKFFDGELFSNYGMAETFGQPWYGGTCLTFKLHYFIPSNFIAMYAYKKCTIFMTSKTESSVTAQLAYQGSLL